MNIKSFIIIMLAVVGMIACSSSSSDEPNVTESVTISSGNITLADYKAATEMVNFKASSNWTATSSASWCQLERSQGQSNASGIQLTIEENSTSSERNATVKIALTSNPSTAASITVTQPSKPEEQPETGAPTGMESTATELVSKIKVGWNLGNTLESGIWEGWSGDDLDIETKWGNPKTTKAMITALKDAGFNAIRIPVRWYVHADDSLNINEKWMARVKEVVDYAYSQGMYVVLNSHHDTWYDRLPVGYNETSIRTKFANMWIQIATAFKDYDEHLILSGANEIIYLNNDGSENWNTPTSAHLKFAASLMQLFVNTVRATGGNNEWRCLMVQPWACSMDNAVDGKFTMPEDMRTNRLIFEFHNYTWNYSTETSSAYYFWGNDYKDYSPWYPNGESGIDALLSKVKTNFLDKGIAVIMAEFGCVQHNKSSNEAKCDESRAYYHKYVVSKAKSYGIPGFYWDNNCFTTDGENFGLLDRKTCTFPERAKIALDGIMDGLK